MSRWRLVFRSLLFYWRPHLGIVLGSILATTVITGALLIGDSVRHTLTTMAHNRLGRVQLALGPSDRFFRDDLEGRGGGWDLKGIT